MAIRELALSNGYSVIVDECDYEWLSQYRWYAKKNGNKWYAARGTRLPGGKKPTLWMHRAILEASKGVQVDHVDGNSLNNSRSNLRLCSPQQNTFNRQAIIGSSHFKGVSFDTRQNRWKASVTVDKKTKTIGYFIEEVAAARAYDQAARLRFGEFAWLNFPDVLVAP